MMSINDFCINCGACIVECPREAIFEFGEKYQNINSTRQPLSLDHYFISTEICDKCAGLRKKKCIEVCPMNAIEENSTG